MTAQLVLASTSPYRRALLERLRLPFTPCAPRIDEEALKDRTLPPAALAASLALAKARSLRDAYPAAAIIGSDQVCECAGETLSKPGDFQGACRQLSTLAGRTHQLLTAVCIVQGDREIGFVDVTRLRMRPLSSDEIERYVQADQPYDCAGSYKLEQLGIALFDEIESQDHTAITGLPLLRLAAELRQWGFAIP